MQKDIHHGNQELENISDQELRKLQTKFIKGCKTIFHKQGYMNSKGDAPYDFQCDSSHLCPKCQKIYRSIFNEKMNRDNKKTIQKNRIKRKKRLQEIRNLYFIGKNGCECSKDKLCKDCALLLQNRVTKLEQGCGAKWEQNFGGLAAGPAWVNCYNNYFLCQNCSQELYMIKQINKEFNVPLAHLPQEQKMFWSPSSTPYYLNI